MHSEKAYTMDRPFSYEMQLPPLICVIWPDEQTGCLYIIMKCSCLLSVDWSPNSSSKSVFSAILTMSWSDNHCCVALFSSPTATSACNLQIQSMFIDAEGWCLYPCQAVLPLHACKPVLLVVGENYRCL